MSDFQVEFEQRLRRVCGVTDDTTQVSYEMDYYESGFVGCDTCGDYTDGGAMIVVKITRDFPAGRFNTRKITEASKEFADLGELMRAMDEVEL